MKISDAILRLTDLQLKHGNLEVVTAYNVAPTFSFSEEVDQEPAIVVE